MKRFLLLTLVVAFAVSGCGGSIEETIAEELIENSDGSISDVEINQDSGEFEISIEGEDGETMTFGGGDQDSGEFEVSIEGEDGETMTFGGGDVPEGMKVAIPDGGEVIQSFSDSSNRSVTLEYPADRYDELVAFYDNELEGAEVTRSASTTSTDDGEMKAVSWFADDAGRNITVNTCFSFLTGELDKACVVIYETDE